MRLCGLYAFGNGGGGDFVGLAFLTEAVYVSDLGGDTLADAAQAITDQRQCVVGGVAGDGERTTIRVFYTGGAAIRLARRERMGIGSGCTRMLRARSLGRGSEDVRERDVTDGVEVTLDFSALQGTMRPDLSGTLYRSYQCHGKCAGLMRRICRRAFERSEFQVVVSDWTVDGDESDVFGGGAGEPPGGGPRSMAFSGIGRRREGIFRGGLSIDDNYWRFGLL